VDVKKAGLMMQRSAVDSFRSGAFNINSWLLFLQFAGSCGVDVTMCNGCALYFHDQFNQNIQSSGAIAFLYGFAAVYARGVGGYISDRFGDKFDEKIPFDGKFENIENYFASGPNDKCVDIYKECIKEGGKRGVEIEGAADMGGLQFFCTTMDEPNGDVDLLYESLRAMNAKSDPSEEERKGGSARIGKMIFSAGSEQLAVLAYIPEALKDSISGIDWLKQVINEHGGEVTKESSATLACGKVPTDQDKGRFPMKIKEPCITSAITYLKGKGLFPDKDDDSDDEFIFGDDDFPS